MLMVRASSRAIALHPKRTNATCTGLTRADVLTLSPKFWLLHTDPIWSVDGAAGTLCTLQLNCCAGTLCMFASGRSDLDSVIQQVLDFEISYVNTSILASACLQGRLAEDSFA
jgi:hypothetical protein